MIEVYPNLFVGDEADARTALSKTGWYIVHACKEPFHRQPLAASRCCCARAPRPTLGPSG